MRGGDVSAKEVRFLELRDLLAMTPQVVGDEERKWVVELRKSRTTDTGPPQIVTNLVELSHRAN